MGTIQVVKGECPYTGEVVAELWDGLVPVVAANVYLRSKVNSRSGTRDTLARRLVPFFQYAADNGWSFWDPALRRGGSRMALFQQATIGRARRGKITHRYARDIMDAVFGLCYWWSENQPGEKVIGRTEVRERKSARGKQDRVVVVRPNVFTVTLPVEERYRENHVLTPHDVERIWELLDKNVRTLRVPRILTQARTGPRPEWSPKKKAAWERERALYATRLAWRRRMVMLWALMITSGMRRGEIPLLMTKDVRAFDSLLWATLRVRKQHRHLGKAKTGGRAIFLEWDRRVAEAWRKWIEVRHHLVAAWMRSTGAKEDHGMFLVNRDGGPLTVLGLMSLLRLIHGHLGLVGHDGPAEEGFVPHPHSFRHTCEAMLRHREVELGVRQRHLGHRREETTARYGKWYRQTYVDTLMRVDRRNTDLGESMP